MRRVLIALTVIGWLSVSSAPAVAQGEGDTPSDAPTSSETTPAPDQTTPAPDQTTPAPDQTTEPEDTTSPGPDGNNGNDGNQGGGAGSGGSGSGPGTGQTTETQEVIEAGQAALEDLIVILAKKPTVRICHRGAAVNNPYQIQNPSADGDVSGHADHDEGGPFDGGPFQTNPWGDIIPPFEFDGGSFPGLNWTAEGQAIYFNDCEVPDDEEPPPPEDQRVSLCHQTGDPSDPYDEETATVTSIFEFHSFEDLLAFVLGATEWGDIIPPFDFGENAEFEGLNWDAEGQAIFFNNCEIPEDPDEGCSDDDDDDDDGDSDGFPDADVDGEPDGDQVVEALDDDDDEDCDDDDDDDGDDDDEDDDDEAALPDTGGPSQWNLILGVMLTIMGMMVLANRESLVRTGLFGPLVPAEGAVVPPWSSFIAATGPKHAADKYKHVGSVVTPEQPAHLGRWTVLGAGALIGLAILGRRPKK